MRAQRWKVPTALLAAVLVAACGGEAESAADATSERVIPAAGEAGEGQGPADTPRATASAAPDAPSRTDPATDAPSQPSRTDPATQTREGSAGSPTGASTPDGSPTGTPPTGTPPTDGPPPEVVPDGPPPEVVRTDPEPSVAPPGPMEMEDERAPEAAPDREPLAAPVGTRLILTIDEELSTRVSATGDPFRATVAEDILGGDGIVLLPRGTPVRGRVIESFESPSSDRPATLALAVEAVELHGRLVPVAATVTELQHETEARDSDGRSAAKVGAGAVAGALLGKIIGGDGEDAVKGAVAGALAGAAVAHATRDGHAKVPAGARMVIVLDQRLVVEP